MGEQLHTSEIDLEVLSRGWSDWLRFAEVVQLFREAGSAAPREDSILWVLRFCSEGVLEAGNYDIQGLNKWPERGRELESRMREWLVPDPRDPLGAVMNLMFDLTAIGRRLIPDELQF
ncbi:hypothetical protein [Arthrobacter glacialis]|uniref:Uncharacterized protein n=1 Tax=Arthrobacter glacialis TaxID=1664 RepID=A0A2S3ZRG0_ARTGL|nr:hypothetical protein [Arthrobacter glacialis]POH71694.1 hypothetical protein CVS27_19715 [Arthrobacter glacialis]